MNEHRESLNFPHSSDTFPMKSDILKIRNDMTLFKESFKSESRQNSSYLPESKSENINNNNHVGSVRRKSQTLPEIILFKKNEEKSLKIDDCVIPVNEKTCYNSNLLLPILRKTLKKMRSNTIYRNIDDIKEYHLNIVNDKVVYMSSILTEHFMISLKIFKPFHPLIMMIKVINFLILLLLFIYIPLDASFSKNFSKTLTDAVNGICVIVLFIETFCKANMGYFSNGTMIKDRLKVFRNYLNCYFLIDFITMFAVCFEYFIETYEYGQEFLLLKLVKFLIFAKGPQFKHLYDELVQYFKLDIYLKGSLELVEILVVSMFLAHIIACLWYFFGSLSMEFQTEMNWIIQKQIINYAWQIQYLYSFYWAVVVMMTVGFGDIVPVNVIEMSFCIVAIFTGCGLFAYNLNKIGIILQKIYREENEFKEEWRIINNFMERKKIDSVLQTRIKEYLKFIWNEKKIHHNDKEMEIISTLSNSLKEELLLESYGGIIKAFPMFYKKFSEKTLKAMVSCIKEIRYVPGDYIFYEKELDDCCLYYINRGSVNILIEGNKKPLNSIKNKSILETLQEGQVFGEYTFFTGTPRIYTAQSTEFVSLLAIKRDDFLKIIQKNSQDYQQFCMVKDSFEFNCNTSNDETLKKCKSCGSHDHITLYCPLVQYIPDREKIIKRYEFNHFQEGNPDFTRVKKRTNNSLFLQKSSIKMAVKIQKELKKSTTLFNFSHLRAFINNDSPLDSDLFDSCKSLSSVENDQSRGSLSSSDEDNGENMKSFTEENFIENVVKDNMKKADEKIMNEDSGKPWSLARIPEVINETQEFHSSFNKEEDIPEIEQRCLKEKNSEIRKNERVNSYKNNDNELKSPSSKQHSKNDREYTYTKHSSRDKRHATNSVIINNNNPSSIPAISSFTKINPSIKERKKSIFSSKNSDSLLGFEKCENFEHYFPDFNIDNILQIYDKKRRKLAFQKQFRPSKEMHAKNLDNYLLKNYSKYSFFPHNVKQKLFAKKEENTPKATNANGQMDTNSPFFKRKEFQKKTMSFQDLVKELLKNKKTKRKGMTLKN